MRKAWLIAGISVLVMGIIAGIVLLNDQKQQPEPSYGGHPLSYWMTELRNNHREERIDGHTMAYWMTGHPDPNAPYWDNTNAAGNAAEAAIRVIGTNALPELIARIKSRPGHTAQMAESLGKKIGVSFRSAQEANRRADEAVFAFGFLGSNAWPAIGPLSNMVCNPHNYILTADSTEALMSLGKPGAKTLVSILADPSVRWRSTISYHIVDARPQELHIVIAALAQLTNDSDKHLREACASNLRLLNRRDPKNAIPQLTKMVMDVKHPHAARGALDTMALFGDVGMEAMVALLRNPNNPNRADTLDALKFCASADQEMVTHELRKHLTDSDPDMRTTATNALRYLEQNSH